MSSSAELDKHPAETKSLIPQLTRTRNIHSPRKFIRHQPPSSLPDESHHPQPPPPPPLHRRCRLILSTLFALTTLIALLSLSAKFIIFPYLLPTPTPVLRILSLSISHPTKPNSSSSSSSNNILAQASVRFSLSNPSWASTFHFSDSAYSLHYKSKSISETNPNVRLHILPQGTLEIAYDMLLEKNDDTKRGLDEMLFRAARGDTILLDMTVYLYGSSAIRPWSVRMFALFYDCVGIDVDFSAADGVGKARSGGACQLVEKLTS